MRERDRRRLAVDEHDARDLRHEQELEVRRHLLDLVARERDEAPVVAPGVVEDVDEELDVLVEGLERGLARR